MKKEVSQWKLDVTKRIHETKIANRKKKYEDLKKEVNEKLHELVHIYFNNYVLDEEENLNTFTICNEEWQSLCKKIKATKANIITLDYKAFEKAVESNLNTPEFKEAIEKMKLDAEKEPEDNCEGGSGNVTSAVLVDEKGNETPIDVSNE